MALQYGPNPRPHNYNSSDSKSEAEQRPTSDQCQKYFNNACSVGDLEAVKRYLSHGASVHGMRGCFTPLYHALSGEFGDKSPSFGVARYLIERGADVNKPARVPVPRYGYPQAGVDETTSWLLAKFCEAGPMEVVEFLLAHGAEANAGALTYACRGQWRSVELCQLLLDHGAPVNLVVSGADTPLWYACISPPDKFGENLTLVAFLLDRGADINQMTANRWWGYLELACSTCDVALARLLLDRGIDYDRNPGFLVDERTEENRLQWLKPLDWVRRNRDSGAYPEIYGPEGVYSMVGTAQNGASNEHWPELIAVLEAAPPAFVRSRMYWRRRILFHVIGRRGANPDSKRHELGQWRITDIASFLMAAPRPRP